MSTQDTFEALDRGRTALLAARDRYKAASDEVTAWAAFVEFLMWTTALDDTYLGAGREADYDHHRRADRDGQVISGLRIPRNATIHALSPVLRPIPPAPKGHINLAQETFVEYSELRQRLNREPSSLQRGRFAASQDRPVRYQMRAVTNFFVKRQAELEQFITH